MSNSNHPIEQEELMAYLDGELATNRAVAAAAHLEHCAECQALAADLRKMSQEMMAWEVEETEAAEISTEIAEELEKREKTGPKKNASSSRPWSILFTPRRLAWAGGVGLVGLLFVSIAIPNLLRSRYSWESRDSVRSRQRFQSAEFRNGNAAPAPPQQKAQPSSNRDYAFVASATKNIVDGYMPGGGGGDATKLAKSTDAQGNESGDDVYSPERSLTEMPMIARVAALTLTTKNFDNARASLEEILKRHNGYMGELKVSAPSDAGRSLTATLRVPALQLEAAMAEMKRLGRVEDESQGGEEVTQQYVDLEARLANGIHTEQRLTEILRTRTGKLQDVLKVELEIDRVRGEIEQMQAEKKELSKRVTFATLNTTIKEEYFAKLQGTPPSTGSRFRNAAVDGYNTVVEGLIGVGLFLLSAGPSLLLWAAILFFPARWAWKKFQAARKRGDAEEESV